MLLNLVEIAFVILDVRHSLHADPNCNLQQLDHAYNINIAIVIS